jgi:hypothetical protein
MALTAHQRSTIVRLIGNFLRFSTPIESPTTTQSARKIISPHHSTQRINIQNP